MGRGSGANSTGENEESEQRYAMYGTLITSINTQIIRHEHELRLMLSTRMKRDKEEIREKGKEEERGFTKSETS